MSEVTIPNFGELLAEFLGDVSPEALPVLLANLERGAAGKYRYWAEMLLNFRESILASASREEDIADRVEQLFPISWAHQLLIDEVTPKAKAAYMAVFAG